MTRHSSQQTEDDDILQNHRSYRVPLHLMDGTNLNRAGFRLGDALTAGDVEKRKAYDEVELRDATAWQRPPGRDADDPVTGSGEVPFIGTREGDVCMTDSKQSGHMKMIDGMMQCVADPAPNKQGMDGLSATEKAYRLADWEAENAWRNPR